MQTPRCGVPDVDAEDIVKLRRPKRYIVGSEGWKKRELTYLYSFDGPSGILAHAYFPYEFGHYGGDVHFDESEKWTIKPKDEYDGLDFFTVAVHEIGHSLGLAHSPVADSIMFPYYKGYTPHFSLAYDDVMAMWELYNEHIKRVGGGNDDLPNLPALPPEGDDVHRRDGDRKKADEEDFYEQDRKRREEEERRRDEERKRRREDEEERRRWEEEVRRKEDEARRREEEERWRWENGVDEALPTTEKPPPPVPSLCDGDFDSMAVLRQELFIFKDTVSRA
ncbi:Matrix metalloproteinase-24 [Penaeus vannamei]|uniref:Matrix metalloproteinase-24 n=1 Tax=Penaeus vannamei TaxID=6689 RepID=A0A423TCC2_PENVA|nr:Matrix metalloproteinase-24 [Penaeus vannamei]